MITITAYTDRQFYRSKYNEKLYIDGSSGDTAIKAAILTGKGLESEEVIVHKAAGKTKERAQEALDDYLSTLNPKPTISRTEIDGQDKA